MALISSGAGWIW